MKPAGSTVRESLPSRAQIRPAMLELLSTLGPTSVRELDEALADHFDLSQEQREVLRSGNDGNRTEWAYRCAWVRTAAKRDGFLILVRPRVWALTSQSQSQ